MLSSLVRSMSKTYINLMISFLIVVLNPSIGHFEQVSGGVIRSFPRLKKIALSTFNKRFYFAYLTHIGWFWADIFHIQLVFEDILDGQSFKKIPKFIIWTFNLEIFPKQLSSIHALFSFWWNIEIKYLISRDCQWGGLDYQIICYIS